jgi:hypothetical protein
MKEIFVRGGEANVRHPHSPKASWNRYKYVRPLGDEVRLLFRGELHIAEALLYGGERRENMAADPEVDRAHMGAFFRSFKAERDPTEIGGGHDY